AYDDHSSAAYAPAPVATSSCNASGNVVPSPSSVCSIEYRTSTSSPSPGTSSMTSVSTWPHTVNGTATPTGYSTTSIATLEVNEDPSPSRPALVVSVALASSGAASDTSCTACAM